MIKPDHISIYVDNEDQQLHSLLQTAQLKVFLTITENQDSHSMLGTPSTSIKNKGICQNLNETSSIRGNVAKSGSLSRSRCKRHRMSKSQLQTLAEEVASLSSVILPPQQKMASIAEVNNGPVYVLFFSIKETISYPQPEHITDLFNRFGHLFSANLKNKGGATKLFGYARFTNEKSAENAILCLNGSRFNQGVILVEKNKAKIRIQDRVCEQRGADVQWTRSRMDQIQQQTLANLNLNQSREEYSLFFTIRGIRDISSFPKPEYITDLFSRLGNLSSAKLKDGKTFGFAHFTSEKSAENAILLLNGFPINQGVLSVEKARPMVRHNEYSNKDQFVQGFGDGGQGTGGSSRKDRNERFDSSNKNTSGKRSKAGTARPKTCSTKNIKHFMDY